MADWLWLIPALPFAGFLILALGGRRLSRPGIAVVGSGLTGIAAAIVLAFDLKFLTVPPPGRVLTQTLWSWIDVGGFNPDVTLRLDPLSLVMTTVITGVGFLILLYSTEYMADDDSYGRFFAYMNLFVGAMLTLVLADNLVLLYLGWEGVGLCSYLLIGFWYKDPENGHAASKAFIVTRVGDTALLIGLFVLYTHLGTLQIQDVMSRAQQEWAVGSGLAVAASLLLLGGAVGKSSQLPLQVWLPDAMAGPTPVSALIHAATMVTAGVYLIARMHVLYELAPRVQALVAVIGALTLLLAGFSALTQRDIKRVLAYSTISQIGYMFLALGVGAWTAALFHFMTHAFFKALLFMAAGAVIVSLHHEQDLFAMGGLRRRLPVVFWTFLFGAMSLAALPLITAGFYSKDAILWAAWSSSRGSAWLWAAGLLGAFLTSVYTFRMVFLAFFGGSHTEISSRPGLRMTVPLVILAFLAIFAGFVQLPRTLGNLPLFSQFLRPILPALPEPNSARHVESLLQVIASLVSLAGVYVAYYVVLGRPGLVAQWCATPGGKALHAFWKAGWGFDWVYGNFLVRPFVFLTRLNEGDVVNLFYAAIAGLARVGHYVLSRTQSGKVRVYAMGMVIGVVVAITVVVFL